MTLRPRQAGWLAVALVLFSICNLGAASYLLLRDDILSAIRAQQRYQYEETVADLRSQLAAITSAYGQDIHDRVRELMERQQLLAQRQHRLEPLLGVRTARNGGASAGSFIPVPSPRPLRGTQAGTGSGPSGSAIEASAYAPEQARIASWPLRLTVEDIDAAEPAPDGTARDAALLEYSLRDVAAQQTVQMETLARQLYLTTERYQAVLESIGLEPDAAAGTGGPLIGAMDVTGFDEQLNELDDALDRLALLRELVLSAPIIDPLPGARITSRFGPRKDPFLEKIAYHAGIDFRASRGELVRATSAGTVTRAGWYGGYGRMVEIDHGSGFTTRYAHLNEILVEVGDRVQTAAPIGRTGNSGRSTGPHLHYEIRRNGTPINPLRFIQAGRQLTKLIH